MSTPMDSGAKAEPPDSLNNKSSSVLPIVYIQAPSKMPFTTNTSSTMVQLATLPPHSKSHQNMILAPVKSAQPKLSGRFITMMAPDNSGKYVIAPMSKVVKSRLPVTVTTNSLQPKIAFMPLTVPTAVTEGGANVGKTFNFKISDGEIQQNSLLICNQKKLPQNNYIREEDNNNDDGDINSMDNELRCDEVISLDSPPRPSSPNKSEKEYELSILEESVEAENPRPVPKLLKHGVFILKKNMQSINNHNMTTTVTENRPKLELPVTTTTVVAEVSNKTVTKTERRRKSNFSYRKDYDEPANNNENAIKATPSEEILKNEDCDLKAILKWDEGIGTLPGSDLKFIMNEFNLVEYVTREEYKKIIHKRMKKVKTLEKIEDFQDELRCKECGCYGLPSEFINTKYCSLSCQSTRREKILNSKENATKLGKNKKRKRKEINQVKMELSGSDDENINDSNDNSQDKYSYPWACAKKGFSWTKYLDHMKAKAAPTKLFKDAFPYNRNGFRPGMKLEGIDPHHPSYFCVLTVAKSVGYRIRLHFDDYPDNYDFWVNADSMDIFPAGWCEKHGHPLQPPSGFTVESFNWVYYLKVTRASAAPKHLFANRTANAICPNGFRVGMKLEAVDRKNTALVCVATVRNMMHNRILVHFDSWDDIYDYWTDPTSPYIHPVGWCDQYGHNLTPPNDYPNPAEFSWNRYLKETKSAAAPARAFKQRPVCGFKRGMRLECVDKRVPQLIRVATVDDVKEHQIRIHFDGWPDRYSYWVDDDSEDIHPAGWCYKTGHPLETPLTPDDVYDFLECPTIGCRGVGHTQGPKYPTHADQKFCPYAENNIDVERVLPDRLLSPDRLIEAVVPVQIEPKEKPKSRMGRPPKYLKLEPKPEAPEVIEEPPKKPKRKYNKRPKLSVSEIDNEESQEESQEKSRALSLIEESKIDPGEKESWPKHSKFLEHYIRDCENPRSWSEDKVANFVMRVPGCRFDSHAFSAMEIDGDAFLSLSQKDLIDILEMKMGPAVKLYNIIVLLRRKSENLTFS